jgi:hypothetical protein
VAVLVIAAVCGCGGSSVGDNVGCTGGVVRAIEVSVFDAQTKAPAADGAVGTVRDGGYMETLRVVGFISSGRPETSTALTLGGAEERPGTYTVRVETAGYEPWEVTGIRVRKGVCHVEGARLEAFLRPSK